MIPRKRAALESGPFPLRPDDARLALRHGNRLSRHRLSGGFDGALRPAQLILADNAKILVDCGSGVTQRLVAAGTPGRALDALRLTPLHSDHLVDLYQLIVSSRSDERRVGK